VGDVRVRCIICSCDNAGEGIGLIIAVSDVHIGYDKCNRADFARFLDWVALQEDVTDLVLAGDILEFWRRDMVAVTIESADIIARLIAMYKGGTNVHYIAGNHDYVVRHLKIFSNRFKFSTKVELKEDGVDYTFIHGWELDPDMNDIFFDPLCWSDDKIGRVADRVWDMYSKYVNPIKYPLEWIRQWISKKTINEMVKPPEEREFTSAFTTAAVDSIIAEDNMLICGHTHSPCIIESKKYANCGSWCTNENIHGTYITIDGNEIQLRKFG
jgi:UDP-2,3-diacylglucosamine pyrophosphatase LpxH